MLVYFYGPMLLEDCIQYKLVLTKRNCNNGICLGFAVQLVVKACKVCTLVDLLGSMRIALQHIYSAQIRQWDLRLFLFLGKALFCSHSIRDLLEKIWCWCQDVGDCTVAYEALSFHDWIDKILHYISSVFFSTNHALVQNRQLHSLKQKLGDWPDMRQCRLETKRRKRLLIVFLKLPMRATEVLKVTGLQGRTTHMVRINDNRIMCPRRWSLLNGLGELVNSFATEK